MFLGPSVVCVILGVGVGLEWGLVGVSVMESGLVGMSVVGLELGLVGMSVVGLESGLVGMSVVGVSVVGLGLVGGGVVGVVGLVGGEVVISGGSSSSSISWSSKNGLVAFIRKEMSFSSSEFGSSCTYDRNNKDDNNTSCSYNTIIIGEVFMRGLGSDLAYEMCMEIHSYKWTGLLTRGGLEKVT